MSIDKNQVNSLLFRILTGVGFLSFPEMQSANIDRRSLPREHSITHFNKVNFL